MSGRNVHLERSSRLVHPPLARRPAAVNPKDRLGSPVLDRAVVVVVRPQEHQGRTPRPSNPMSTHCHAAKAATTSRLSTR